MPPPTRSILDCARNGASAYSSTTTKVAGCFIAGLLMIRTVFLSGETSRIRPPRASAMKVLPLGSEHGRWAI